MTIPNINTIVSPAKYSGIKNLNTPFLKRLVLANNVRFSRASLRLQAQLGGIFSPFCTKPQQDDDKRITSFRLRP